MVLSLYHDPPASAVHFRRLLDDDLIARLKSLDARITRKGLGSLDPQRNNLIALGTEMDAQGRVTKNSYGVFHLPWRAEQAGDWAGRIHGELAEIRERIRVTHGQRLRFLIWAGMGGSAEDKSMYLGTGLLKRGPKVYVLDSTDPAKLKAILEDMQKRSGLGLTEVLRSSLVAGMALGMTSYEPVVNLEKLYNLYQKHQVDSRPNFIYMTLPGSLLDQFASARGYRRVELQLDNGNSTAGRHSSPLTRGSLYPLGLAGVDLEAWISGTFLSERNIQTAFRLSAFLQANAEAGRDKVTLLLAKDWEGCGVWTKQDFEESLGKSEAIGIKIIVGEKPKLANYYSRKDPKQNRVFLAIRRTGEAGPDAKKLALLRRSGYPVALLTLPQGAPLSSYMQFIHYTVFGLGYLRQMNFVTQPGVELYKAITNRLHQQAQASGGIRSSTDWEEFTSPATTLRHRGGISLHYPFVKPPDLNASPAPAAYARLLRHFRSEGMADTGELTFFGDTRYSPRGRAVRKVLERAGERVFRRGARIPVDIYEGPAMNHSYHEMIIGHGKCFSTVLLSDQQESLPAAGYTADYHLAQFLATQMALGERGRAVVAIVLKDLSEASLRALDEFFRQAAAHLK